MQVSTPEVPIGHFGRLLRVREIDGISFVKTDHDPNVRAGRHCHGVAVFNVLLEGSAQEKVVYGPEHHYEKFVMVYHPVDEEHACQIGPKGSVAFGICIRPDKLESLTQHSPILMEPAVLRGPQFSSIVQRMLLEFELDDGASLLALHGLALETIAAMSRFTLGKKDKKPQPWLAQAREILHARASENLSLTELARLVSIHPVHLAQEFRRYYGCTIGEYVRNLRIKDARHQLAKTNRAIADIAVQAGFYDQAHFSRVFKAATGLTPSAFRRAASSPDMSMPEYQN